MDAKLKSMASAALFALGAITSGASHGQITSTNAEWSRIVNAARNQQRVVFYSATPISVVDRLVAAFRKQYPDIAIESSRGLSGAMMAKVDQEQKNNVDGADVFINTEMSWMEVQRKEGRLLKPAGPSSLDWPAQYILGGTVVVGGLEPWIIIYNKRLTATPPRGYQDLLLPEFKGKIGTTDLASTAIVAWYDWLERTQGADFLQKLKLQNPKFYSGAAPLGQAVASGEITVSAFGVPTATRPLMEQGAQIDYVVPSPGIGNRYAIAAFGWSKRPEAALVLLDFLMSPAGQTAWHGRGESASPRPGIPGALSANAVAHWVPEDFPPDVAKKSAERWNQRFR